MVTTCASTKNGMKLGNVGSPVANNKTKKESVMPESDNTLPLLIWYKAWQAKNCGVGLLGSQEIC